MKTPPCTGLYHYHPDHHHFDSTNHHFCRLPLPRHSYFYYPTHDYTDTHHARPHPQQFVTHQTTVTITTTTSFSTLTQLPLPLGSNTPVTLSHTITTEHHQHRCSQCEPFCFMCNSALRVHESICPTHEVEEWKTPTGWTTIRHQDRSSNVTLQGLSGRVRHRLPRFDLCFLLLRGLVPLRPMTDSFRPTTVTHV